MDRITIETGMQDISSGTCIKFVPRTHEASFLDIQPRYGWVRLRAMTLTCDTSLDILHLMIVWWLCVWFMIFFCAQSCWSYLGQVGGSQTLSLQSPGCMWSGVAAHEFMHALGFVHEQSRSDRDHYVTIVWKNIMPGWDELSPHQHHVTTFKKFVSFFFVNLVPAFFTDHIHNFRKQTTNNLNSPYDYTSVMHYGRWGKIIVCYAMFLWGLTTIYLMYFWCRYAFSEDGGPTIIPKPDPYIPIGQRDGPSALDLHKINVLYNCGRWTYTFIGLLKI